MNSRTTSPLVGLVFACALGGALSGCSGADNPAPAKPTETPPPTTETDLKPHTTEDGKTYGGGSLYKKMMTKQQGGH